MEDSFEKKVFTRELTQKIKYLDGTVGWYHSLDKHGHK